VKATNMLKRSHLTTTSIALLAFGIAGCLVFAVVGELLARVIQYDVFKLLAQFFIVTVLGAAATMVYADHSWAREKREQKREILRETLRQLIEVYKRMQAGPAPLASEGNLHRPVGEEICQAGSVRCPARAAQRRPAAS